MRNIVSSVVACILLASPSTFGAIVYSGSQNVTLTLNPMTPMSVNEIIDVAGAPGDWDDFEVILAASLSMTPGTMYPMGMMGAETHLHIYAPGSMSAGGSMSLNAGEIVGLGTVASNLAAGAEIGPSSSFTDDGWGLLTGSGEFGADGGYIGLVMDNPLVGRHYGWVLMLGQTGIGTDDRTVTFDSWAYETQNDTPIAAGETPVVPLPAALCLGLLGFATVGLVRSRLKSNG